MHVYKLYNLVTVYFCLSQMRIGQESDSEEVIEDGGSVTSEATVPSIKSVSESSDTGQDVNRLSDSCFETPSESDSVPELLPNTAPAIKKTVRVQLLCSTVKRIPLAQLQCIVIQYTMDIDTLCTM